MEIEQLRKELNNLLENLVDHSQSYSGNRQIPSLQISYALSKVNKMQETLILLKHLLQEEERQLKQKRTEAKPAPEAVIEQEEVQQQVVSTPEPEVIQQPVIESEPEVPIQETIIENEPTKEATPISNIEQLPITNLVDVFSLNDRYLYANELFDKDMSAFNEIVKTLDAFSNLSEAKSLLSETGTNRNWDEENEHVISFYSLVERRFLS